MTNALSIKDRFLDTFKCLPDIVTRAPGRVNIIGDHTDYNDGFALPCAISFSTTVAASLSGNSETYVYATDFETTPLQITQDTLASTNNSGWLAYVAGAITLLKQRYNIISGANILISGNIPIGAGLSSSASLEIALINAYKELFNLPLTALDAAKLGQMVEHQYAGCNCGIMDQLASASCKKDYAMLLDCQTLEYRHISIPDDCSIVIVDSKIPRGLVDSQYNDRRKQCEEIAETFGVQSLRDISVATLNLNKNKLNDTLFKRALHVITENERVNKTVNALQTNDLTTLNTIMRESHESLRDNYEVSIKEMDFLVRLIDQYLDGKGGVRMTGGGFGGCAVAIMPKAKIDGLSEFIKTRYREFANVDADVYVCFATDGAFESNNKGPKQC